jgi:hypothetical protein
VSVLPRPVGDQAKPLLRAGRRRAISSGNEGFAGLAPIFVVIPVVPVVALGIGIALSHDCQQSVSVTGIS